MHVQLSPGPTWFSGTDFFLDIVTIAILLVIAGFAWRFYSLSRENNRHLWMFISLITLAFSYVFKILTYSMLYATTYTVDALNVFGEFVFFLKPDNLLFTLFFSAYSIFTLAGLFILFMVYEHKTSISVKFLIIYLLLITALFSESPYVFMHLTAMVLTILITYALWKNYKKNKLQSTLNIAIVFALMSISRIFFIYSSLHISLYVIGEILNIVAFIGLLITFIMVLINGKKKRKT